jgi:hypothetical protein
MSDKGKEMERLRQSDDSIGEKVDFATLIWRQIDEVRRMREFSILKDDAGLTYFSAVEGLVDLLSGIEEKSFVDELRQIEDSVEKTRQKCIAHNNAKDKRETPDWFLYGRRYFRVCMKFIQTKGFGFTEIQTEKI